MVQISIGGRAEKEKERKKRTLPDAGQGPSYKGVRIEGWKIRRRGVVNVQKKRRKKKETTKYHVARGRKLRDFFFRSRKGGPEPKKKIEREREKEDRKMMKICGGTRKGRRVPWISEFPTKSIGYAEGWR